MRRRLFISLWVLWHLDEDIGIPWIINLPEKKNNKQQLKMKCEQMKYIRWAGKNIEDAIKWFSHAYGVNLFSSFFFPTVFRVN